MSARPVPRPAAAAAAPSARPSSADFDLGLSDDEHDSELDLGDDNGEAEYEEVEVEEEVEVDDAQEQQQHGGAAAHAAGPPAPAADPAAAEYSDHGASFDDFPDGDLLADLDSSLPDDGPMINAQPQPDEAAPEANDKQAEEQQEEESEAAPPTPVAATVVAAVAASPPAPVSAPSPALVAAPVTSSPQAAAAVAAPPVVTAATPAPTAAAAAAPTAPAAAPSPVLAPPAPAPAAAAEPAAADDDPFADFPDDDGLLDFGDDAAAEEESASPVAAASAPAAAAFKPRAAADDGESDLDLDLDAPAQAAEERPEAATPVAAAAVAAAPEEVAEDEPSPPPAAEEEPVTPRLASSVSPPAAGAAKSASKVKSSASATKPAPKSVSTPQKSAAPATPRSSPKPVTPAPRATPRSAAKATPKPSPAKPSPAAVRPASAAAAPKAAVAKPATPAKSAAKPTAKPAAKPAPSSALKAAGPKLSAAPAASLPFRSPASPSAAPRPTPAAVDQSADTSAATSPKLTAASDPALAATAETAVLAAPLPASANPASRSHCALCQTAFDLADHLPILLHAGHNFCAACFLSHPDLAAVGALVTCPLCRVVITIPQDAGAKSATVAASSKAKHAESKSEESKGVATASSIPFPVNFLLRDQLEVATVVSAPAASSPAVMCARCDDGAAAKCLTCDSFLCDFHETDHRRSRDTAAHTLQPISAFFAANPVSVHSKVYCAIHPQNEYELFCLECSLPICVRCSLPGGSVHCSGGAHPVSHPTEELRLSSQRQLHELHNANELIKQKYAAILAAMVSLQGVATDIAAKEQTVAAAITKAFERIHEVVEARKERLLAKLTELVASKSQRLTAQNQALYTMAKSIEDASSEVDDMLAAVGANGDSGAASATVSKTNSSASPTSSSPPLPLAPPPPASASAKLLCVQSHLLSNLEALTQFQPVSLQPEESAAFGFTITTPLAAVEGAVEAAPAAAPSVPSSAAARDASPRRPASASAGSPLKPRKRSARLPSWTVPFDSDMFSPSAPLEDSRLMASIASAGLIGDSQAIASNCTASGDGLQSALVRVESRFEIQARDRFNQPKTSGGDPFVVEYLGPAGTARGVLTDLHNGKYAARYSVLTPGSYSIVVSIHGRHIAGSPFKLTVLGSFDSGVFSTGREWSGAFGSRGSGQGQQFMNPMGMAAHAGLLWLADYGNNRVSAFKITPPHAFVRSIGKVVASSGASLSASSDSLSSLKNPWSVAVDPLTGHLYVSDCGNHRIVVFTPQGELVRSWGSVGSGQGKFRHPAGIAIYTPQAAVAAAPATSVQPPAKAVDESSDPSADITVPAGASHSTPSTHDAALLSLSASPLSPSASPPPATPFSAGSTGALASTLSQQQLVCVCDRERHRIQVFDTEGRFLRSWGSSGSGAGQFLHPSSICVSATGTVLVADFSNARIQAFNLAGGFLHMWGQRGSAIGQFIDPVGIAVDREGIVFVADQVNNEPTDVHSGGRPHC